MFGQALLSAQGITTQPTDEVLLSPSAFERCTAIEPFRRFVFVVLADRQASLMALAEAVAFQWHQRLAGCPLRHGPVLQIIHQALADQPGTVREIGTWLPKRFVQAARLALAHARVPMLDPAALRALTAGPR